MAMDVNTTDSSWDLMRWLCLQKLDYTSISMSLVMDFLMDVLVLKDLTLPIGTQVHVDVACQCIYLLFCI